LANAYVDTVSVARRKFPGQRASLDALCERFNIDNSARTKHGALLDAELLAEVYLELSGGRQRDLGLAPEMAGVAASGGLSAGNRPVRPPRLHAPSAAELAAHAEFLKQITDPVWLTA
jgi:DNA polymerase-3 subunit epsilon